ncbi:serine carboxypeptidase-like 5 isoform X2 [Phalaenopsis equestris]|uniref:serine carboxypeptidase-like 5 isoform X2 n=1 Tax=Phalaenopsis equestris TaxID=78828 RepID=UPI0009E65636|nr:serine carboxypeptidase-like 5 isoform X2 [Phalaenopsis equestris]
MSTSGRQLPLLLQAALCHVLFFSLLSSSFSASYNITHLPGFDGSLPFRLETGYVTMNATSGAELFYYFVESERNPSEDPLLLWLIGGPGCSGINGLALDMGPLKFKLDYFDGQLPNLYANPFAWTKISNMIFVDWPIGTGFSYSKTAKDYTTEDVEGTAFIYKFLRKLIMAHCAGEKDFKKPQNVLCATHLETLNGFLSEIDVYSILDPTCPDEPPTSAMRSLKENQEEFISSPLSSVPDISCITAALLANYWANHHLVKEALHVKEGTIERFHLDNFDVDSYFYTRSVPSIVPYHYSLITRGFRALVYSGDHDLSIPFLGTLEWIKSLNFSVLEPRRSWHAGGQVAGYTILFSNNLTFATVKGGSHIAPDTMPFECFVMFERWISHQSL